MRNLILNVHSFPGEVCQFRGHGARRLSLRKSPASHTVWSDPSSQARKLCEILIPNPQALVPASLCHSLFTRAAAAVSDNRGMRTLFSFGLFAAMVTVAPAVLAAQAPPAAAGASIAGAWTRNADLSDAPAERGQRGDDSGREGGDSRGRNGGGGGGRRGGGGGGGGFGGRGGRGGGMGRGGERPNPDEMARMREAMRDVTNPSDHLTIVQTDSMVLVTGADGRTTRMSADGKKIKDENTRVDRKTKWDAGRLVSEISGLGPGKMTQTFAGDPENRRLRITVVMENTRSKEPRTITQVYDADPR